MCGIVGVFSTVKFDREKNAGLFSQLLYADVFRGRDSTGIALINKEKNDIQIAKMAVPSYVFLGMDGGKALSESAKDTDYFLGHNRAATKGELIDSNAHPFEFENVVGMHNGTISNHNSFTKGFEVDSEAVYSSINDRGIEETVKDIDGSFALLYYDKADGTLKAIRNSERPLSFSKIKGSDTLVISSESLLSDWIIDRNNRSSESVVEMKSGVLYSFNPDKIKEHEEKTLPLRKKTYYMQEYYRGHQRYFPKNGKRETLVPPHKISGFPNLSVGDLIEVVPNEFVLYNNSKEHGKLICNSIEDPWAMVELNGLYQTDAVRLLQKNYFYVRITGSHNASGDVKIFAVAATATYLIGPNKEKVSRKRWDYLTQHGCAWCSCSITDEMSGKLKWTSTSMPICNDCGKTPTLIEGI